MDAALSHLQFEGSLKTADTCENITEVNVIFSVNILLASLSASLFVLDLK